MYAMYIISNPYLIRSDDYAYIYQSVTSDMLPALDLQVDGCYQHLVICKPDLQPCSSWRGVCVQMYMYNIIVRHAGACTEPKRDNDMGPCGNESCTVACGSSEN